MNEKTRKNKGITLVEIMLYMAIISVVLIVTTAFLSNILSARIKNQTINEVESQGMQVLQILTAEIKDADSIFHPGAGSQHPMIRITKNGDETRFRVVNGVFYIEKDGEETNLTNDRVFVSDHTFQNLSRQETPGILSFQFTLKHINPGDRQEYSFEKEFSGSASLRNYN